MTRFRLPLAVSLAGHAGGLIALALMVGIVPKPLPRPTPKAIEILLPPPPREPLPVAAAPVPEPPPVAKQEPSPPPPPVVRHEPSPPPPHPKSKPAVVHRLPPPEAAPPRQRLVREPPPEPLPRPYYPPVQVPPPLVTQPATQTAALPRPMPEPPRAPVGPIVSPGYRAALAAWMESHKRYPESARERGESGQAMLRFRVERSGRVLSYSVVKSTGYPDLDAAIEQMMRGAVLPPFPSDMTALDVDVSVVVRFALR